MASKAPTLQTKALTFIHGLPAYVPIIGWLRGYQRDWLRVDLIAGLTVWGLMVPSAMGYAQVAGVPAQMGLYAAMAGTLIYAIFSTSRQVKVSTSSTPAIMSATIVTALAAGNPDQIIPLSITLAFVTGCLFVAAGIFKLGFLADFMSKSVITGFIFGLAAVVVIGQVPKLFGIPKVDGNAFQQVLGILAELDQTNPWTFALGAGALALILFIKRRYQKIPAALVALVAGIVIVTVFNLDEQGVQIVGLVPAGLPAFGFNLNLNDVINLLPSAAALVVVLFGESVGSARTFATKHRYEINASQEMIALGVSNIGSSFMQGFTIDASLSNSAAADEAGAKTQLSSIITGVMIVITVIALTPLFQNLPQAVLGAIVITSVLGLLDVAELRRIYSLRKSDFWLALISMLGVLAIGVLSGLLIAVLLSLLLVLYRASRPNGAVIGKAPDRPAFGDIARNPGYELIPGVLMYRLDAALFFANVNLVRNQLRDLSRQYAAKTIIIDLAATYSLDVSSLDMIDEVLRDSRETGIDILLVHVKGPVREVLQKSGFTDKLGTGHIFDSFDTALASLNRSPSDAIVRVETPPQANAVAGTP